MFLNSTTRTILIWVGLVLFWGLNAVSTQYGPPYIATYEGIEYYVQDPLVSWELYWFLYTLALAFTMTGCYIWTRLKNRSWAFILWGLLTPIGLLGISLLKDKSSNVQTTR